MPSSATVTAQTGPGRQITSGVISDVSQVQFDLGKRVLRIQSDIPSGSLREFDLAAATTVTCVISAGNYAFTIS